MERSSVHAFLEKMKNSLNNQSIQNSIDQLVRSYQTPVGSSKEEAWNTILSEIEKNNKSKYAVRSRSVMLRIAGIAAVAALIVLIYLTSATIQYTGIEGKIASIRLPDNSRVILESNGHLSLKKYFWNRNVKLNGTAYFEVEKGSTFSVNTQTGSVEVLGTRFLVSEANKTITVQCFEGKVKTQVGKNSYTLTAGNQLENANANQNTEIQSIENEFPEVAIFKGIYKSRYLNEMITELESFFGVKIELNTQANQKFTGTIQTARIENAMEIISASLELEYKFTNQNEIQIY